MVHVLVSINDSVWQVVSFAFCNCKCFENSKWRHVFLTGNLEYIQSSSSSRKPTGSLQNDNFSVHITSYICHLKSPYIYQNTLPEISDKY